MRTVRNRAEAALRDYTKTSIIGSGKPVAFVGSAQRDLVGLPAAAQDRFGAIYVASFPEAIYVLHVFEKKSQRTAQRDIQVARARLRRVRSSRMGDK
jgi:phage-related protein